LFSTYIELAKRTVEKREAKIKLVKALKEDTGALKKENKEIRKKLTENQRKFKKLTEGQQQKKLELAEWESEADEKERVLAAENEARKAREKGLKVHNHIDTPLAVFTDVDMINTVIRNLLSNAVKFTPDSGEITLDAEKTSNGYIKICIKDTGVGIKPEAIQKIYDRNTIYSTPGTNDESGTGLGLKLCKEFIELNKGNIWIESEPGKGTQFCFTLPEKENSYS